MQPFGRQQSSSEAHSSHSHDGLETMLVVVTNLGAMRFCSSMYPSGRSLLLGTLLLLHACWQDDPVLVCAVDSLSCASHSQLYFGCVKFTDTDDLKPHMSSSNRPQSPSEGAAPRSPVSGGLALRMLPSHKSHTVKPIAWPTSKETDLLAREYMQLAIAKERSKTWREQCSTIFSFSYFKEIAPAVVLGIVAIMALAASARAQQQLNEVNSNIISAQVQFATAQAQVITLTSTVQSLTVQLESLQDSAVRATIDANTTYAAALAQKQQTQTFFAANFP
jgi:hypothetical protein